MLKQQRKSTARKSRPAQLPIGDIVPDPNQPRKSIAGEKLNELKQSFQGSGQISPVVVRPTPEGKYMIVVGERRWRAAKESGFSHIDCIIRHDLDDRKARELQFAENYLREDVPPLEQSRAFREYLDKYNVSQREMARRTGIPQRTISARLALLSLPESMHAQIEAGHIGPHEALMISELPPAHQPTVVTLVASGKLGSRALESLCTLSKASPNVPIGEIINQIEHDMIVLSSQTTEVRTPHDAISPLPNSGKGEPSLSSVESQDLKDLIRIVKAIGIEKQERCECLHEDGRCSYWDWEDRESIPEGIGDPVCPKGYSWFIKPSVFLCAICSGDAMDLAFSVNCKLNGDPLVGLKQDFKCDCGAKGEVAVNIKCTHCGRVTWWGFWPK